MLSDDLATFAVGVEKIFAFQGSSPGTCDQGHSSSMGMPATGSCGIRNSGQPPRWSRVLAPTDPDLAAAACSRI